MISSWKSIGIIVLKSNWVMLFYPKSSGQGQFKQDLPKKVKRPPIKVAPGLDEDSEHDTAPSPGELGEAEVPLGSKFGEKKSPRRSADLPPLNGPPVSEGGIKSGALPPLGE